jgi:hypothetical protein
MFFLRQAPLGRILPGVEQRHKEQRGGNGTLHAAYSAFQRPMVYGTALAAPTPSTRRACANGAMNHRSTAAPTASTIHACMR